MHRLLRLRNLDGSWDVCPFTRYGSDARSWIGNAAVTTAFAVAALHLPLQHQQHHHDNHGDAKVTASTD